jgi:Domain of unknown function (DUF4844)
MKITSESLRSLRELRSRKKFMEEDFYPGAPDEETRVRCQSLTDRLIDDLLLLLGAGASEDEILSRAKETIDVFDIEDTEEREKVEDYLGEMMQAIDIDDWTDRI